MSEKFEMVAKTFQGLEGVLADELTALGADEVAQGVRMVSFRGDKRLMYKANFACRTALSILKPFYKFRSDDVDDLYRRLLDYDWSRIMSVNQTFAISVTASGNEFRNTQFVTYRVKDAIVDYFTSHGDKRPSIRVTNPDVRFDVHIAGTEVTLSLNSSGDPLYKRGWRVGQTDAPINEVLAAGIVLLSGWRGESDLVDPMCGSGTFLVEAAMIATNTAPGVFRNDYAFQRWPDYDADLYDEIYNDDSEEREFTHKIYGSDLSGKAIAIARANAKSAGMARHIELELRDLTTIESAPQGCTVISNPPYGKRLGGDENLQALYAAIGERLKHVFKGCNAWLICIDDKELVRHIGLKPSQRYPLLNGAIECNLLHYVMFEGKYDEMRGRGETIRGGEFRASDEHRGEHRRFREMRADRPRRDGDDRPRRDGDDRPRRDGDDRPRREFNDRPRHDSDSEDRHSEEYARRVLRGREPQLGEDKTVPVMRERRRKPDGNNDNK